MQRLVVASPEYLARHGVPQTLDDLPHHHCLAATQQRGWVFRHPDKPGETALIKISGRIECNDGAVLHEWALAGEGLAWRSLWEVGDDLRAGRLVAVLDHLATPPIGITAVFPQRRHLPLRVRLFIDLLKNTYGNPDYWKPSARP